MAKPAQAAGALLATVTNVANTLSNGVNTINNGFSMLNNYTERQLVKQQDASTFDIECSRIQMIEDHALEIAERAKLIASKTADPAFKAVYDAAHARLTSLVTKEQTST